MAFSIRNITALIRYKVSLAVTFTAVTTCILFSGHVDFLTLYLAFGVFILAGGASALNQYMERDSDARMNRTRNRPVPSGKISPHHALLISLIMIVCGLGILYFFTGLVSVLLGLFNILWYNFFYTRLKKFTAYAVIPGAFTGSVPALIGWTAAGGGLFDPAILFVSIFIYIWQVPHFWLLLIKYGKEYEDAGFPCFNRGIPPERLRKIIYSWIISTSLVSMMFPLFKIITSIPVSLGLLALNAWFVIAFTRFTFKEPSSLNLRHTFFSFNTYMFLMMLLLLISQLAGSQL